MIDPNKLHLKSRLGTILVNRKQITSAQLEQALAMQASQQIRVGEALVKLGFIDEKQLAKALTKQNWLRTATTSLALVLAPFSPAFAANQGNIGNTSSASSQISVTILPKTLLNGEQAVKLEGKSSHITEPLCMSNLGNGTNDFLYSIKASGSGKDGAFQLTNTNNHPLDYQVAFQHQDTNFDRLKAKQNSRSYQTSANNSCDVSDSSRVKISIDNEQDTKVAALSSRNAYSGTLTLTIAAE